MDTSGTHKTFDLVIFGASGFTGRLAVQYMMSSGRGDGWRIAIAGRDKNKLALLQASCLIKPTILIADSSQPETIDLMVRQTKVVLSFAGPFSLYGEPVIAACAKYGVDYLDITGETPFIRDMILRYQDQAYVTGARLIPFSGFDSVPADLLVLLAIKASRRYHLQFESLCLYYQIKGGFNGGTLASALHMAEHADKESMQNINCLIPEALPSSSSSAISQLKPRFEPILNRWTAPFFMEAINRAVVHRSAWLREQDEGNGQVIQYEERMVMGGRFGYLKASLTKAFLILYQFLATYSLGRKLLKRLGPKPGEGPPTVEREQGFFRGRLFCYQQSLCKLIVSIERAGDPGNEITVALACESALLAIENAFITQRKGFLTPSVAFGDVLIHKLEQVGFHFETKIQ